MALSPLLTLNNGLTMPAIGLGTWQSKPGEVTQAVKDAIDVGYRHIDGAFLYQNEKEVGGAISEKIEEGVVKREDMFMVSKLWNTHHRPGIVEETCRNTITSMGLDYLDLYLMHTPMANKEGPEIFPLVDGIAVTEDYDYLDTWLAMEELVNLGLVKSIGLSNFNKGQTERILSNCNIKPVTNQVECHPYLNQEKLSSFLKENDVILTAYSPLGSPERPWAKPGDRNVMEDPQIREIADKYGKTVGQILIRYQLDRGHAVLPKSVNNERIIENFSVMDITLSDDDLDYINGFNCNERYYPFDLFNGHKDHPFTNDEY